MKEKVARFIPGFTILLFLTVASVGAFAGGVWGVAGIAGAIVLFAAVGLAERRMPEPARDLMIMALIALGVMALSNLNSSQSDISWLEWRRLATVFLPLILFSSPAIQAHAYYPKLFFLLSFAAVAGAMMLSLELDGGGPILKALKGSTASLQQYNRGLSYLVILALPIMAWLWTPGRRLSAMLFFFILLLPTGLTESRAAKLALLVAVAVTVLAHIGPVLTRRALAMLSIVFIGWPFAAQSLFLNHFDWLKHLPDSWRARMEIWDYMSYRIMERPVLGWGLGASHTLDFRHPHGANYVFTTYPAAHPHNAIIQLWVEMGLPGLALGICFAFLTLRRAGRLDPKLVPFALGAWAAALCLSLVAYDLWTDSMFAAFALTGFAFALLEKERGKTGHIPVTSQ